ncbi:hypothetical protein QE152_g32553 [Popillia japonica]|uniref:Uncharacterized protein n=1 Tax=Popillia japonica TaxID=7064 RepID=A0AAW1IYG4_POPJA
MKFSLIFFFLAMILMAVTAYPDPNHGGEVGAEHGSHAGHTHGHHGARQTSESDDSSSEESRGHHGATGHH